MQHVYLVFGFGLVCVLWALLYVLTHRDNDQEQHPALDFCLVWPILLR
ncbi:hypothetical protein SAMN02745857_00807 [Andreprevotia lacus DSM 23236]|jgi:hypothetical protein|uniref:Uncharacterized protein n=1 Tax=Andreprevotia lacus DSM 23236 TaxID=1121001 RepID=A0A1W1X7C0_9NEIS|nr:hypothetical protein SAMN02745857_00807 [Andreprevotia lacus DSM 23236]